MIVYQEELKILDLYRKNLFGEYNIKEIMNLLNKRSYHWTYKAVNKLQGLLKTRRKGNTNLITANLENPQLITYFSFLDRKEAHRTNMDIIEELIKSLSKKTSYFTLLLTGSYANKTQTKNSDLDIVVITPVNAKKIMPYIEEVNRLSDICIDAHLFSPEEFKKMLISKSENFGKEVFRNHVLFYGTEAYYQIIKEVVKDGLQTKI